MQSLNYLEVLLRWKNFIIVNVLLVSLLAIGVVLLLPNWYKATASILPPKQPDLFGATLGTNPLLKGLGAKSLGGLGKMSTGYNYLAILKSRTSMERVINRFDLMSVYGISGGNMDKAVKELEENTLFETQDEDNITIDVYDKDPKRAADMANYFVEVLNSMSIQLATQEARNNREFIEKRLDQCRQDLRQAEDGLKAFQEKKDIIVAEYANNTSITAYAELYAMKAKKEIEVAVLERKVGPDNEMLMQMKAELHELTRKLSSFPEIGLQAIRLYREVVTQERILEFLLPVFEQAKIDEQKDVPVLLVLDIASPPHKKAKPQRALIVVLISFVSLTFLVMVVFFFRRLEADKDAQGSLVDRTRILISKARQVYHIRT